MILYPNISPQTNAVKDSVSVSLEIQTVWTQLPANLKSRKEKMVSLTEQHLGLNEPGGRFLNTMRIIYSPNCIPQSPR